MKILSLGTKLEEIKSQEPWEGSGPPPPNSKSRMLQVSWTCDICKYSVARLLPQKQAYTHDDVVNIAKGVFNFAFFDCLCPEIAAKKKLNGKAEAKPTEPSLAKSEDKCTKT